MQNPDPIQEVRKRLFQVAKDLEDHRKQINQLFEQIDRLRQKVQDVKTAINSNL